MMLTTGTSPPTLTASILKKFRITRCLVVRAPTTRPEISYKVTVYATEILAKEALLDEVRTTMQGYGPNQKALIFCRCRDTVDNVAAELRCKPFHKGLDDEQLRLNWREFMSSENPTAMVTSPVGGTGVNIPNLPKVWNLGRSWTPLDYAQESGRAGREKQRAFAHLITWQDELDDPNIPPDLLRFIEGTGCRRAVLGEALDGHPVSCLMLSNPHLCDNCEREILRQRVGTIATAHQAPGPVHSAQTTQPQVTRRPQKPAATVSVPRQPPRPNTRPSFGLEGQRSAGDPQPSKPRARANLTAGNPSGSRTAGQRTATTTAANPTKTKPQGTSLAKKTPADSSSVLHRLCLFITRAENFFFLFLCVCPPRSHLSKRKRPMANGLDGIKPEPADDRDSLEELAAKRSKPGGKPLNLDATMIIRNTSDAALVVGQIRTFIERMKNVDDCSVCFVITGKRNSLHPPGDAVCPHRLCRKGDPEWSAFCKLIEFAATRRLCWGCYLPTVSPRTSSIKRSLI